MKRKRKKAAPVNWINLAENRAKEAANQNIETRDFLKVENMAGEDGPAKVYLYGYITPFPYSENEHSATTVLGTLQSITADEIELHINSAGGSVFEGVAIHNILSDHPATINVKIDGMCGSIATTIALAGDHIEMAKNASWMIHNPTSSVWGESSDMRSAADMLDQLKESILNTYEDATGKDRNTLSSWMDEEKMFTAQEALDEGFVDSIKTTVPSAKTTGESENSTTSQPENNASQAAKSRFAMERFNSLASC